MVALVVMGGGWLEEAESEGALRAGSKRRTYQHIVPSDSQAIGSQQPLSSASLQTPSKES